MSKLPKPTLWKLWNPAEAQEHSPGTSATGNGHSKKHTSVHLVAFDLYYLDQRSNDYICLKDHNEGQRCKKGQFNPIQDCIWARHTQNRGSKTLQTQKVRTRGFPSPVSDYSVRSGGGDILLESDSNLQFLTVPSQNSSYSYTLGESITPTLHSAQIYIHHPHLLSPARVRCSHWFSTFYHRTNNFIFFSLQVSAQ